MSYDVNTVGELLARAASELSQAGVPAPRWDAEVLLGSIIGKPPLMLPLLATEQVSEEAVMRFGAMIGRRAAREPLQYILGHQEFMGLDFTVDGRVLVPRPETEHLVEAAIAHLDVLTKGRVAGDTPAALLAVDLGTGSGAVAISLAARVRNLHVFATDLSTNAITVATDNAERQRVADRVDFLVGDLFAPLPADLHGRLALVVSNPPYIATDELPGLQPEVQREPLSALDGGPDGLDFYRRIVAEAPRWLCAGGLLALEIGDRQGEEVTRMLVGAGSYAGWCVQKDYAGHDRVVLAKTRGESGCSSP